MQKLVTSCCMCVMYDIKDHALGHTWSMAVAIAIYNSNIQLTHIGVINIRRQLKYAEGLLVS